MNTSAWEGHTGPLLLSALLRRKGTLSVQVFDFETKDIHGGQMCLAWWKHLENPQTGYSKPFRCEIILPLSSTLINRSHKY